MKRNIQKPATAFSHISDQATLNYLLTSSPGHLKTDNYLIAIFILFSERKVEIIQKNLLVCPSLLSFSVSSQSVT